MLLIPDRQFLSGKILEVFFQNRFGQPELEMLVEESIEGDSADVVVVVTVMQRWEEADFV